MTFSKAKAYTFGPMVINIKVILKAEKWKEMLAFLIPHYQDEGKHRLVIAVGCTGGAHRSVAIAEAIGAYLRELGMPTEVSHRDLQLEQARWAVPIEEG